MARDCGPPSLCRTGARKMAKNSFETTSWRCRQGESVIRARTRAWPGWPGRGYARAGPWQIFL